MDELKYLIVNSKISIPWAEITISFARSSGPGGQNVNKVNSKAILDWHFAESQSLPIDVKARFRERFASKLSTDGRLVLASDEFRAQEANVRSCADKLRNMILAIAEPPKIRRATKPTRGSKERRLQGKRERAKVKSNRKSFDGDY